MRYLATGILLAVSFLSSPAAAETLFVCNPFSTARAGWAQIPAAGGAGVRIEIRPLETRLLAQRAGLLPAGVQPLPGLYFARPRDSRSFELLGEPPLRGYVVDLNGNGRPDFFGDRWVFADARGDVQCIVEFHDTNGDGKAEQIDFYLTHYWAPKRPGSEGAAMLGKNQELVPIAKPWKLDAVLAPHADLGPPTDSWADKNHDGTWCTGSILTGGEVCADWLKRSGPLLSHISYQDWNEPMLAAEVRCYDLDGDGDIDILATSDGTYRHCFAWIDISDQASNPQVHYDLLAGSGKCTWPQVTSQAWREIWGSFGWWKGTSKQLGDLKDKYHLWMGSQDTPHGVLDLDGDGIRDAFIGVSCSGGPADIFERPGQPPAVWQSLERLFMGLAGPRQLNFNIDFNPYKRPRPDRNLSLPIRTYTDKWGNKLENFVGAFSPPDNWDGKALSPYNADGSAAPWTWLWDWHLTKPYKDLYVAAWVKDYRHTGEGAAVALGMQDHRVEADFDCSTNFSLYYSPIINWFHLNGVEWGWWIVHAPPPAEIRQRFGDLEKAYGLFQFNQFRYSTEVIDTDIRRFYATSWACYFDADGDGIIDTYLLDKDNDGLFDTRLWYDHARGRVTWAIGNRFQTAPLKLEFPAESLALKNYRALRKFYQAKMTGQPLLDMSDGTVHVEGGQPASPAAVVAVDAFHNGGTAGCCDLGRPGFSRLLTSVSRRPVAVQTLDSAWSAAALHGVTHLIVTDLAEQSLPTPAEWAAMDDWLHAGAALLLILPATENGRKAVAPWATRYGLAVTSPAEGKCLPELTHFRGPGGQPLAFGRLKDGLIIDPCPAIETAGAGRALLTYQNGGAPARLLAAEVDVGRGRVVLCAARSLLSNAYTAYKPPGVRPFWEQHLANRGWMEAIVERLLPCGDAYARH
jgi:hypothetical protein